MITIRVFENPRELGEELAREIADGIVEARENGRSYVLGCPGGRTPRPVYQALAQEIAERKISVSHVVIAMMDDYANLDDSGAFVNVDSTAHFSCRRFGEREILQTLNASAILDTIPESSLWLPDAGSPDAYEARLREIGGIDLFILASGASDGHVAFNPPGSLSSSTTRVVELATSTKSDNLATFPEFNDIDDVPNFGVTVGISTISALSKLMVLIVTGEDKRKAFQILSTATEYDPQWPASVVVTKSDARLYADKDAVG